MSIVPAFHFLDTHESLEDILKACDENFKIVLTLN